MSVTPASGRVLTDPGAHPLKTLFANYEPWLTGLLRGLLLAILLAAARSGLAYVQGHGIPGQTEAVDGTVVTVLMFLIGVWDKKQVTGAPR